ncbi:MAG: hypothetical protein J1F09_03375 [Oscillospiraceae bacterium]|nr:hypothetical protein [Oscillospiraceae bacterium]
MAYNSIEKLVSRYEKGVLITPWEYCFEMEADGMTDDEKRELETFKGKDAIERYLIYRSTSCDCVQSVYIEGHNLAKDNIKKYGIIPDCDGSDGYCKLAIDLYAKLWNAEKTKNKNGFEIKDISFAEKGKKLTFGGDTMNSFQTTLNWLLQHFEETLYEFGQYKKERQRNNFSLNFCLQVYSIYKDYIYNLKKADDKLLGGKLNKYADTYHTLGNFVLVPSGFNKGRSSSTCDFWDSSLVWLKSGYDDKFNSDDFNKYINYFFLWDYVDGVDEKGKFKIKPLFKSHDKIEQGNWTNITSKEEAEQFMENAARFILRRGIFMTAMLKLATNEEYTETYKTLQKKIFSSDECYNGFNSVIEKVMEYDLPSDVRTILEHEELT